MLRFLGFRDHGMSPRRRYRSRCGLERSPKRRRSCSDSGRSTISEEECGRISCSGDGGSAQGMPSESSEANVYRQCRGIKIRGPDAPNPIKSFRDTPFPESIIQEMSKSGFLRPTPLQSQVWPLALKGCDLFALSQKGSGRRLAYLLPAIVHAQSQPKLRLGDGPIVLVLTTQSFDAIQIQEDYTKFCGASPIKSFCMHIKSAQPSFLHLPTGVEILISTPQLLENNLNLGLTSLERVTYLVVDHATEMILDPRLGPALRQIFSVIRLDCQKLFFSAERPENFETFDDLAMTSLSHRVLYKVVIGSPDFEPNLSICQSVSRVAKHRKLKELVKLLGDMMHGGRILIFMDKGKCDKIARLLRAKGWTVFSIHEGISEVKKDYILSAFQAGRIHIIIASDFAARDIDVTDVKYVINYDFPGSLDDYVHRIGLIGTSGLKRTAQTFFTDANARFAKELISLLEKSEQTVTPELAAMGRDAPNPKGKIILPAVDTNGEFDVTYFIGGRCVRESVDCPWVIDAAIFALKEVKLQKKLHFVRVLDACVRTNGSAYEAYDMILEAVEGGEVKACIAIVVQNFCGGSPKNIIVFGLVDGGKLVKLIGTEEVWSSPACDWLREMLEPEI